MAVSQEERGVSCQLEGWWFDPDFFHANVSLGKKIEPQVATDL